MAINLKKSFFFESFSECFGYLQRKRELAIWYLIVVKELLGIEHFSMENKFIHLYCANPYENFQKYLQELIEYNHYILKVILLKI